MKDNQQILGTEPVSKLLIKYSLPAIIGMVVNGLYNVVDRVFIGNIPNVGPLAITGLGVTMPIMTIILAFGMLLGIGATANISIKLGQGKKDEAEKIVGNAITLSVIIGLIISIVGLVFGNQILQIFGASAESLPYAKSYVNIILLGAVFNLLSIVFNNTIRGDGNPKLSATIMVVGCITNIILDAVLIMMLNMGIEGAAIATVISQIITAIWGMLYYLKGKSNLKVKAINLRLDRKLVGMVVAIGAAPFAMQIASSCVQVISNNALKTHGGDLAIAAMATINSVILMIGMPIMGITQGAQPIIGFNYGAGKYDRVRKTVKICTVVATIGLTIGWILVQVVPTPVVSMFNSDESLVRMSVDGIRKFLAVVPIIGVSIVGSTYFQSVGKAKHAIVIGLLRQVLLLVPMILILPNVFGLDGVWFAQPIADVISTIVTVVLIIKDWRNHSDIKNNAETTELKQVKA